MHLDHFSRFADIQTYTQTDRPCYSFSSNRARSLSLGIIWLRCGRVCRVCGYRKAVRATLILIPLLGLQYVLFPMRPDRRGRIEDVYLLTVAVVTSLQVALTSRRVTVTNCYKPLYTSIAKVTGKAPWGSETPERISTKLKIKYRTMSCV